jgi:hypothetical protein
MIGSRQQAAERVLRDVALRRAALLRLRKVSAEIEALEERRTATWGLLGRSPDRATSAHAKSLGERLAALWSEARALRACALHGEHALILERARSDILIERSEVA